MAAQPVTPARAAFYSPTTGKLVEEYEPIRIWVYDPAPYPAALLNPLARALLLTDPRYAEGRYLFERVHRAEDADLLLFPCDLNWFEGREETVFAELCHYPGAEDRHLFFDHRDTPAVFPSGSICLKVSVHRHQLGPRVHCIPYMEMVDNFLSYLHRPRPSEHPLSFIGERTALRDRVIPRIESAIPGCYFRLRESFFHGALMQHPAVVRPAPRRDPVLERWWRMEFIGAMLRSRMALSLPGFGLNAFRFFEALSLGVPVLQVADDCALPWEDAVDYLAFSRCVSLYPEETLPERLAEVLAGISDERLGEMRRMARLYYDAYLSSRNFLFLLYRALAPALGRRAALLADAAPHAARRRRA